MKEDVKAALAVLREHGIMIPRKLIHRASVDVPTIHLADQKKFRAYCEMAWKKRIRFVVGWGGAWNKPVHLTFHTAAGYEGRKKHAQDMHKVETVVERKRRKAPMATDLRNGAVTTKENV